MVRVRVRVRLRARVRVRLRVSWPMGVPVGRGIYVWRARSFNTRLVFSDAERGVTLR